MAEHQDDRTAIRNLLTWTGEPEFANDQQEVFFRSEAPELLYSGAFGAGKSRILCYKAVWLAQTYPGAQIIICRKTLHSLAGTTLRTLFRFALPPEQVARAHATQGWVDLHNGSRISWVGLDPDPLTKVPSKIGSMEADFIYVDEAVELTEADWIMLLGRLRSSGVADWTQLGGATNPATPDHWLKQRFAGNPKRQYLHARTFDNRLLPPDYLERMDDFAPGIFRSRYVDGEWISIDGDVFRRDWFHNVPFVPDRMMQRRVGIDLAASTKQTADYTAVVEVVEDLRDHALIVVGAWRDKLSHGHREWLLNGPPHLSNGRDFTQVNVESVAFQSTFFHELTSRTRLPARAIHPDKDKLTRALPLAARYESGKVFHLQGGPGIAELEAELLSFPGGGHDDLVDALVYAAAIGSTYTGPASTFSEVA